jgi:hypothetical protein
MGRNSWTATVDLRAALANIHNDRLWWRKILIGGALMLTVFGYPWAAGLVMESLDNARKGFPTPLPPWREWSTRYLIGLFAVLIDFVFFVLPAFLIGLLFFCGALASVATDADGGVSWLAPVSGVVLLLYEATMFSISVAPVGRLIYADRGRPEEAMSVQSLRDALNPRARRVYAQARLLSLPAYLPAVLLGAACWFVGRGAFAGAAPLALILLWLTLSALLYAHLAVVQLYAAAERVVRYGVDSFAR